VRIAAVHEIGRHRSGHVFGLLQTLYPGGAHLRLGPPQVLFVDALFCDLIEKSQRRLGRRGDLVRGQLHLHLERAVNI
jgi:hypothetical protein